MLIFMTPNMNVNFLNVLLLIFKPKIVFDFLSKIASCRSRNHFMPPYQTAPSLIPTKLGLIMKIFIFCTFRTPAQQNIKNVR